ncbi:uncharacterized protein F4822DRAFT_423751 [Hypoxylon trugodes]|uniref:uncharacterized protein n=1 Tax=Hypoxylon trugodes TaxID=326681 RepID=UPI0021908BF5|nr:uncharacterized protein F4822DRAFT_423751 [Hypoxylon trugodes]KAI1393283.1 hypothetical protein F4822DRAFT_423751 [Hypoxylon trugodes]
MDIRPLALKSLITVSAFVQLFALFKLNASNVKTNSSTATYAAVLVAFVARDEDLCGDAEQE